MLNRRRESPETRPIEPSRSLDTADVVEARRISPRGTVSGLAVLLVFAAASAYIAVSSNSPKGELWWVGVAAAFALAVWLGVVSRTRVRADARGLSSVTAFSASSIAWREVTDVYVEPLGSGVVRCVIARDRRIAWLEWWSNAHALELVVDEHLSLGGAFDLIGTRERDLPGTYSVRLTRLLGSIPTAGFGLYMTFAFVRLTVQETPFYLRQPASDLIPWVLASVFVILFSLAGAFLGAGDTVSTIANARIRVVATLEGIARYEGSDTASIAWCEVTSLAFRGHALLGTSSIEIASERDSLRLPATLHDFRTLVAFVRKKVPNLPIR